jgi:uncharacterized protein
MLDAASFGVLSGAALLGAASFRAAQVVRGLVRRREHEVETTERRRAAFANQLDSALHYARAKESALRAWIGLRKFRVSAVVDEAVDCRSFYLVPEDGRPLARFEPGQYLTFHLPSGDPMRPLVRCYSLSDRPREDFYRVTIKQTVEGRGSRYFHAAVHAGGMLEAEAPQGAFFLDPTDDLPLVLVGGGIGVTPIMSMAAALVHRGDSRPIYAFTGFRNSREHPFRVRLAELAASAPNVRLDVSYSRPLINDQRDRDFNHHGHVNVARLRQVLPSSNFRYYVCGPAGMMESLVPELLRWGVPAGHIHYEAFGPASVQGLCGHAATAPCEVQFTRSAKALHWTGAESSLLELAERGGVPLESGCRAGSCGQCRLMVAAGRVVHAKPPGVQLIDGECLACIARPVGDVIVDA